jgi:hypothetical protein
MRQGLACPATACVAALAKTHAVATQTHCPLQYEGMQGQGGAVSHGAAGASGRFLIRLCDLVGSHRAELGCFCRLPGRGVPRGEGGGGRPVGHAAVPPAVRR